MISHLRRPAEPPARRAARPATGYFGPDTQNQRPANQLLDVDAELREDIDMAVQHFQLQFRM